MTLVNPGAFILDEMHRFVNDIFCICRYKHESVSPLDDLAFDMYQDPEVAHIIRLLDDKKQEMVRLERYHLAKKLKQAIADLQKVISPEPS